MNLCLPEGDVFRLKWDNDFGNGKGLYENGGVAIGDQCGSSGHPFPSHPLLAPALPPVGKGKTAL